MSSLYDSLVGLSPVHDREMLDGYQRYVSLLEAALPPDAIDAYATAIQQAGELRIFEEMTPAEIGSLSPDVRPVATAVLGDENLSMENRRVVALLNQRGQHAVAPDLGQGQEMPKRVYAT